MKMVLTLTSAWSCLAVTLILLAAMFILDFKYQKECKRANALDTLNHKNELKYAHNLHAKQLTIDSLKDELNYYKTDNKHCRDSISFFKQLSFERQKKINELLSDYDKHNSDSINKHNLEIKNCLYCGKVLDKTTSPFRIFCNHNCQNSYLKENKTTSFRNTKTGL